MAITKETKKYIITFLFIALLTVASVLVRLTPHIPNVTPIAAIAILAGATLSMPLAIAMPALALLVSDSIIGFAPRPIAFAVYGSFLITVLLGTWLKNKKSSWRILGTALASSILFYIVTNAAVWKFSGLYPPTFDGLLLSYYYAIPFFRATLLGNMAYTFSLFMVWQYAPAFARQFAAYLKSLRAKAITNG